MSLTSYRAAPPRGRSEDRGRRSAIGSETGLSSVGSELWGSKWRPARPGPGACCHLSSVIWSWTAGQAWRRPALPPLGGQYPGRGAVSRPSSEWGRVGPARCDHQAGAEVQRAEDRGQAARRPPSRCDPRSFEVVKLLGMGGRGSKTGDRRSKGERARAGHRAFCSLSSVLCPLERSRKRASALGAERRRAWFERLGPVGCTRYRALTSGLSTWWSTTALNETWFGGGFPA